jgi:hypothetical protein
MRYSWAVVTISCLMVGLSGAWASDVCVEAMPPSVVRTVPAAGETGVDPSLREIRVTFSKDMMTDRMWSWVMASEDSFPEITGDVKYLDDKRTCVVWSRGNVSPSSRSPGVRHGLFSGGPGMRAR